MAKFDGFMCDKCGEVWTSDKMSVETVTRKGYAGVGTFRGELCPPCAQVPEGYREVTRNGRKSKGDEQGLST